MSYFALRDFPDWLSPVLVKELRQGLRSRAFLVTFVLLHLVMGVYLLLAALSFELHSFASQDGRTHFSDFTPFDVFFWIILAVPLLIVLPMRGSRVLSEEFSGAKMDMIYLTHLGTAGVVLGKWVAVNAMIVLFVIAVLPYLLARYFLGLDIVSDFRMLAQFTFVAMWVGTLYIGYSGAVVPVRRAIVLPALFLAAGMPFTMSAFFFNQAGVQSDWSEKITVFVGLLCIAGYWLLAAMWKAGHNSGLWYLGKRALLVVFALLGLWFMREDNFLKFWSVVFWVALYFGIIDELQDGSVLTSRHAVLLARLPNMFRWSLRWVYPGWYWAVFYLGVLVLLMFGAMFYLFPLIDTLTGIAQRNENLLHSFRFVASFWLSMLLGVVVGHGLLGRLRLPGLVMVVFHVLMALSGRFVIELLDESIIQNVTLLFFPVTLALFDLFEPSSVDSLANWEQIVGFVYLPLCLVLMAVMHFVGTGQRAEAALLEREVEEDLRRHVPRG